MKKLFVRGKHFGVNILIEAKNIVKIYGKENTKVNALNGNDLTIQKGEFISIQGSSGCGKSTLLNILGCLEKPTSGELFY